MVWGKVNSTSKEMTDWSQHEDERMMIRKWHLGEKIKKARQKRWTCTVKNKKGKIEYSSI